MTYHFVSLMVLVAMEWFFGFDFSVGCKFVGEKLRNFYTNAHKRGIDRHPDRTKIDFRLQIQGN